jgi:hypothetical protein
MEEIVQLHDPAALLLDKSPRYPLDRRLGGPPNRSDKCKGKGKFVPLLN